MTQDNKHSEAEARACDVAARGYADLAFNGRSSVDFDAATVGLGAGAAGPEARMRRMMGSGLVAAAPVVRVPDWGPLWLRIRVTQRRQRRVEAWWDAACARLRSATGQDWLRLIAPDGYVRQAACETLSGPVPTPFLGGVALRRLNDWAEPVRVAAERQLPNVLMATDPDLAGAILASALRQAHRGRGWARGREALDKILGVAGMADTVAKHLIVTRSGPAASVLVQLLRAGHGDNHLRRIASEAVQPGLRAVAAQALIEGRATWAEGTEWMWIDKSMGERIKRPKLMSRLLSVPRADLPEMRRFASDPSPRVRRAVLDGLDRARRDDGLPIGASMENDPWPSIAHRARVLTRQS